PASGAHADSVLFHQDFQSLSAPSKWSDGSVHGNMKAVFNGYGSVGVVKSDSKVLELKPRRSASAGETHSSLVTSKATFGDLDYRVRAKTVKQLRAGTPNPWETAWVVWHYRDNTHFYYLALKTNGWELGKENPKYPGAQRFLKTGSSPKFPVGHWNSVEVHQVGATMRITVNGHKLVKFTDRKHPYLNGSVGMYTEDAKVFYDNVSVSHA
ncbi:MAG: family 16 glycoside hydrolase, partial [Actinomycetota bacterium]